MKFKVGDKVKIAKYGLMYGEGIELPSSLSAYPWLTINYVSEGIPRVGIKQCATRFHPEHFRPYKEPQWDEEENS